MFRVGGRYSPLVSGIGAAVTAGGLYGRVLRNIKNKRKWSKYKEQPWNPPSKKRKVPSGPNAKPPTNPSSKVTAQYAVAPKMRRFKKAKKVSKLKVPKTVSVHYKDYGQYTANRALFINHEHWGSNDRFWYAIASGLTKLLLPKAKLYPAKSLDDPVIGPRTDPADLDSMITGDDVVTADQTQLYLTFATEGDEGVITYDTAQTSMIRASSINPDQYKSFKEIATAISTILQDKYFAKNKTWLHSAQFRLQASGTDNTMQEKNINMNPVTVMNLDDAEICVYVNSLIKFQNVTLADTATVGGALNPAAYARDAIDANPLEGRVYSARGQHPIIDTDLAASGDRTLDRFFGDTQVHGLTLCGHANAHTAADVGRIAHLPVPKRLYGNQTVTAGTIHIGPGAMKFHKTYFTMKRTFRSLADVVSQQQSSAIDEANLMKDNFNRHTLFGFTIQHKHGEDTIKLGYNREVTTSCVVKHKHHVHPIKQHFAYNNGEDTTTVVPSEFEL